MKILVFGGRGWVASYVLNFIDEQEDEIIISDIRVDDTKALKLELDKHTPTHVLCLIGRTSGPGNATVDYLELPGKLQENVRDNLYGPLTLALECKERNIHMTYFGTGCIFYNKDPNSQFSEDDDPNFFGSSYSIVKGFTDRLMKYFDLHVLNARIRMPISDDTSKKSFISKILNYKQICSAYNSMTVLNDILPVLIDMMRQKTTGTFNMVNPGVISHDEVLTLYKEIVDNTFTWTNFSEEEQNTILKAKRSTAALANDKLQQLYPSIPNIHDAVRVIMHSIKLQYESEDPISLLPF